jgi:hypothetical protein
MRKKTNDRITQMAEEKDGEVFTDNENIMRISTDFYKKLFTTERVNEKIQNKLLNNVKTKLSKEDRTKLDKPFTEEEVFSAIRNLPKGKSPGIDGFPVEFYREYWGRIKNLFMSYLNEVKNDGLSKSRNVSVIKLIYKKTGEIFLLTNYRPISLINADVKIISKVLADRLKLVLPTIIHETQTAVYGRKIDQNIHLIRDLIELANRNDDTAAFIFLDQEKAFDRINHKFMFKAMEAFGIGETFVNWVRTIYSNPTSILHINGHFSENISLKRGVRQGCPLSALLYVLVIEILAIQLRINPNIVGFKIGGEKIVSTHYMDDTTIIIKQNRCFKEVIKELGEYEEATEAKINYKKTTGLWTGSWKNRRSSPIENIKWSSGDVKNLGIYFGNDNPEQKTFNDITPKFKKRLAFWKQFSLSKMGKAAVAEMFLASKLFYASKFYPIPSNISSDIQNSISDFVNFPNRVNTVSQKEMWKTKVNGGLKLVNIQLKSETSKAKWLVEIATNRSFKIHLELFTELVGRQKGNNLGKDLIFMLKRHVSRVLDIKSPFYKEALISVSIFNKIKGLPTVRAWDEENIFYNPLILSNSEKTLIETDYFRTNSITKLGQLLEEKTKQSRGLPFDRKAVGLLESIKLNLDTRKEDTIILTGNKDVKMSLITQKELYEEALKKKYSQDHSYQTKWVMKLDSMVIWEEVWIMVHNFLLTNQTKTAIWEQLHLNFYTQYSYNKWHGTTDVCPLCNEQPLDIYHMIFDCNFVNTVWTDLTPILDRLHTKILDDDEKALGIVHIRPTNGMILRNWVTYKTREEILAYERVSYHSKKPSLRIFKERLTQSFHSEIKQWLDRYSNENRLDVFEKVVADRGILCEIIEEGEYRLHKLFL